MNVYILCKGAPAEYIGFVQDFINVAMLRPCSHLLSVDIVIEPDYGNIIRFYFHEI